jgi:hypothetical protein
MASVPKLLKGGRDMVEVEEVEVEEDNNEMHVRGGRAEEWQWQRQRRQIHKAAERRGKDSQPSLRIWPSLPI